MSIGRLHQVHEGLKIEILQKPEAIPIGTITSTDHEVTGYLVGMLELSLGTVDAGGTVDVTVRQADKAGGTYDPIFIATQIVQAGEDKTYYLPLELRNPKLKSFMEFEIVTAVAASDGAAYLLLSHPINTPITQDVDFVELAGAWTANILPDLS